jgi:hypothetical protein
MLEDMFGFLKSSAFNTFFSFILGLGLMSLFIPRCSGTACNKYKAGPLQEIEASVYQIGSKCYHFDSYAVSCPQSSKDIVEAFRRGR